MELLVLRNIVGFLVQVLPCGVLCFAPFTRRVTVSWPRLVRLIAAIIVIALIPFTIVGTMPLEGALATSRLLIQNTLFLVTLGVLFALYVRAIDASVAQKAFVFLLVMGYGFLVTQAEDTTGTLVGVPVFTDGHLYPLPKLAILVAYNAVFFIPMLRLMRYVRDMLETFSDDRTWWRMAVLPATLLLAMLVGGWLPAQWLDAVQLNCALVLALTPFALFQYWWVLRSTRAAADDAKRRERLEASLRHSQLEGADLARRLEEERRRADAAEATQHPVEEPKNEAAKEEPIVLATTAKAVSFLPADVSYIESANRLRLVHLTNGEVASTTLALADIVELLPKGQFVYCHRSVVVALDHVREVRRSEVLLDDGTVVAASRRRYQELIEAMSARG